jgi:hypothetical protein
MGARARTRTYVLQESRSSPRRGVPKRPSRLGNSQAYSLGLSWNSQSGCGRRRSLSDYGHAHILTKSRNLTTLLFIELAPGSASAMLRSLSLIYVVYTPKPVNVTTSGLAEAKYAALIVGERCIPTFGGRPARGYETGEQNAEDRSGNADCSRVRDHRCVRCFCGTGQRRCYCRINRAPNRSGHSSP